MNKVYLGDAVYACIDAQGALVLTTENGINHTNTIVLETFVLKNLMLYLESLKPEISRLP